MPVGRAPHTDPPVEWKISLPTSLAAKVELMLLDPVTGRTTYGRRSALIAQLLRAWLATTEVKEIQQ